MALRKLQKLSVLQAKGIASDMLASRMELVESDQMLEGFRLRIMGMYNREPTDGEIMMFRQELSKIIKRLSKRSEKAPEGV